ncbi:MAG: ABC transporter substrate-binding protein [Anaerolineales bacterium]
MKKTLVLLLALAMILSLGLLSCSSTAEVPTEAPAEEEEPAEAPAEAEEPAEMPAADPMDYLDAPREDTLIIDNPYRLENKENWNPWVPNNTYNWGMSEFGMDGLMYLNYGDGEYIMWMAESFESNDDATVWTLKLRPGITWNDGVPFTVDDIIYGIELQVANEGLGSHFYYKEWLDNVEKVDDLTMVYTLTKPNVRFADERGGGNLGLFGDAYVPKHIWENVEDPMTFTNYDPEQGLPLGTGPYILAKITENETIWVRNDDWWGAKTGMAKLPEPLQIIHSYVGTEEVRTQTAIEDGFDSMQDITPGALEALVAQNPNWVAWYPEKPYAAPDPCARILALNSLVAPWDDKDMRQMLSYVMDRKQIVDIAYEGSTTLAAYFWPAYPSMDPYAELIDPDVYQSFLTPNLDAAEQILLDKGYVKGDQYWEKDGEELSIEIQVPEDFIELIRIGDVYVEQLQKFGINAVEVKLGSVFYDNSSEGNYEAQSNWFACGSISNPWATLNTFAGEAAPIGERADGPPINNAFRWSNQEYTDLVAQIGTTALDDPELLVLTKQALAILYDELPALPAAQSRKIVPFNNTYWTNWPTNDNYYMWPCNWCSTFNYTLTQIEKVK